MTEIDLRCYCCGEQLGSTFALVTLSESPTDRVFLMNTDHVERAESKHVMPVVNKADCCCDARDANLGAAHEMSFEIARLRLIEEAAGLVEAFVSRNGEIRRNNREMTALRKVLTDPLST